ncbi:MAG: hypothetical protein JO353_06180 [Phycisphaerae bacterium]|nr:hypothetical protein [Phycisphaerae bacterium]
MPVSTLGRGLTVIEGGLGFGFLAIIIGYLPVFYQAFSRRELQISLLDARAGSPSTGGEFLLRAVHDGRIIDVESVLRDWEVWCAELLESHISFPVLAFYRSQHANQSWLAALSTMLDGCALLLAILTTDASQQTRMTIAMARHAAVDIALIFGMKRSSKTMDRFPPEAQQMLRNRLRNLGLDFSNEAEKRFAEYRGFYEPFLITLADFLVFDLPPVILTNATADNWQRSAWMPRAPGIGDLTAKSDPDHFT